MCFGIEELFKTLEGLPPYRGQTFSSCVGLVAFGHRMGDLWAPKCGPFGPLDKYKYIYSANTNTNTYIALIQIHIGCKYKYNNRGQICYIGVVV